MEASPRIVTIVEDSLTLEKSLPTLRAATRLGVDTESNGFYSYHEKVCLIQISTPQADFIVDPLAVPSIEPLAELFESPRIEKVFHGGDYDIVSLKRDFGFRFSRLFDTVVACKLLEGQEVALSKLLYRYFGVELDKTLQRSDWGRRPLTMRHLEYAVLDSRYLLPLSDILRKQLRDAGLLATAEQLFERLCERTWTGLPFNPEGYRRIKGYFQLDPRARGVLRELYALRDRWARHMNRPPFKVIGNVGLLHLAQHRPTTAEHLCRAKGFPKRPDAELVSEVLAVLEADVPEPEFAPPQNPDGRRRRRRRRRGSPPSNGRPDPAAD